MALHRVEGLGVAMEDHETRMISSLEPDVDARVVEVAVAGVSALLVAKAYKLGERLANPDRPDRQTLKDASDIIGLMIASDAYEVADTFGRLLIVPRVAQATQQGLRYVRQLFGVATAPGVQMAVQALTAVKDPDEIRALAPAYVALLPRPDA
jgi:hypothetical protein